MILLGGIPSESPLRMLTAALDAIGAPWRLFNQRRAADCAMWFSVDADGVAGELELCGERLDLSAVTGVYLRLMDDRILPELRGEPEGSAPRRRTRALHDTLCRWMELADAHVVNRSDPQGSNGSKPFQAQLIAAHGLRVPDTLITTDPAEALAFRDRHGQVIYKSMSGVRSIVKALDEDDVRRLPDICWCPVQFQALVPGRDVRVHVVGGDVHATEIVTDRADYRYASRTGGTTSLRAIELPDWLTERCVELTAGLGLVFSGIDLRLGPDGGATCFEVNPSPAYSYYQANTGQPIAASLARVLAGGCKRAA